MGEDEKDFGKQAEKYHKYYQGKINTKLKVPVEKLEDFSFWYTPGVAKPCETISKNPEKVFDYTNRSNLIAVVSDGTRVLGLEDIGPEAGLPVMEGKALLFKYLGGVDAYPLCIDTDKEDEIVETVKRLSPSFGGINLEDIESPKCFSVLENLREELDIPVWHDDQQGTALVSLAGLLGSLKVVGKDIEEIKLAIVGAGAAGLNNAKYSVEAGVKPENIKIVDSKGLLSTSREDIMKNEYKRRWAEKTNPENIEGGKEEAFDEADACIASSAPGPGIIKKKHVKLMADNAIIFATANPTPEIMPQDAKDAGARVVGTGRSDFPNQVNNSLGFPAVFRGALEVRAEQITDKMCISASKAIAERAEELGLSEDSVIPTMEDTEMYVKEAMAVAETAKKQGVARKEISKEKLEKRIRKKLKIPKEVNRLLRKEGIVSNFPE